MKVTFGDKSTLVERTQLENWLKRYLTVFSYEGNKEEQKE